MKRKLLIFMMMCLVGCWHPAMAQETKVSIGNNTGGASYAPLETYFGYSFSEQIFTEKEISAAGGMSGVITQIGFEISRGSGSMNRSWTIYMKNLLNGVTFTDGYNIAVTDDMLVYEGTNTIPVTTTEFKVDIADFTYEGGDLLIGVYDHTGLSYSDDLYFKTDHVNKGYAIKCNSDTEIDFSQQKNISTVSTLRMNVNLYIQAGPQELSCKVTANDSENATVYVNNVVNLTAAAAGGTETYTNYSWTGVDSSNGHTATFTPTAIDSYEISCTVTDDSGETATGTITLNAVEEPEDPFAGKQFRIKVNSGNYANKYLHINSFNSPTRNSQVGIAPQEESNAQIFTIEDAGDGNYYLKSADGYYIKCNDGNDDGNWAVAAYSATDKTPLVFEYTDGTAFYIIDYDKQTGNGNQSASSDKYFKVQDNLVYCNAPITMQDLYEYVCTWVLEEVEIKPLAITSISAEPTEIYTDEFSVVSINVEGGKKDYTYLWSCDNATISDWDKVQQSFYFYPNVAGTYNFTCTVTDAEGEIVTSDPVTVTAKAKPLSISAYTWDNESYSNVTTKKVVIGEMVYINANITGGNSNNYSSTWESTPELASDVLTTYNEGAYPSAEFTAKEAGTFVFSCTASDGNETVKSNEVTIEVIEACQVEFTLKDSNGDTWDGAYLTYTVNGGDASSINKYSYLSYETTTLTFDKNAEIVVSYNSGSYDNQNSFTIQYKDGDVIYTSNGTPTAGEVVRFTVDCSVKPLEVEVLADQNDVTVGTPVQLRANVSGGVGSYSTFVWSPAAGLSDPYSQYPIFTPEAAGTYNFTCTVTKGNETVSDDVTVTVLSEDDMPKYLIVKESGYCDNNGYLPIKDNYLYSFSQQIYTKDELSSLGNKDNIFSVAFKAFELSQTPEYATRNFEVYLKNVDQDELEDYVAVESNDLYYSGDVILNNGDWTEITLSKPFQYLGANILVCVNDKSGTNAGTDFCYYYTEGNKVQSMLSYDDNAAFDASNPTASPTAGTEKPFAENKIKNQIKIGYNLWANPKLVANIIADNTSLCDGDNNNVFNLLAEKVADATYEWYCNDDEYPFSTDRETSYANENPGTYTITLKVTQNGVTKTDTEILLTINPIPDVTLNAPSAHAGQTVEFTLTNPTENADYTFVVYKDGEPVSNELKPENNVCSWTTNTTGSYYVKLTAALNGCENTTTKYFTIFEAASFYYDAPICSGNTITFTANDIQDFTDASWTITNQQGEPVYTISNVERKTMDYTFETAGIYNVKVTIRRANYSTGYTSSEYDANITVYATPEITDITPDMPVAQVPVTFDVVCDTEVSSMTWYVDGKEVDNDGSYVFPAARDDYMISVTVVTDGGCSDTFEKTMTVSDKPSGAKVSYLGNEINEEDFVDMSYRPLGAWMAPAEVRIEPDGTTPLILESVEIVGDEFDGEQLNFIKILNEINNVVVKPGETFTLQLSHDAENEMWNALLEGAEIGADNGVLSSDILNANIKIACTGVEERMIPLNYIVYIPAESDVVETAVEVTETYSTEGGVSNIAPNYQLDGAQLTDYDAVYKLVLEGDNAVSATVTDGIDAHIYFYNYNEEDKFNGEDGPGMTNYIGWEPEQELPFQGFSFTFENDPSFNTGNTTGTGWNCSGMCAELNWDTYAKFVYGTAENGYFITTEKYNITSAARLSFDTWTDGSGIDYQVFVSEDGENFVTVTEGSVSFNSATLVDVDMSQYAGGSYYIGIKRNSANGAGFYLDNISLYEQTRTARDAEGTTVSKILGEGTYYVVASSSKQDFNVAITIEDLKAPQKPSEPNPHNVTNVNIAATEALTFTLADFTTEYQVLFGTDKDNMSVLVEWTSTKTNELSVEMPELEPNNVYYWRVDARNIKGTTEGELWYFATPFDGPEASLDKEEIMIDESALLSWTELVPAVKAYNIVVDNNVYSVVEDAETLQYTLSDLAYNEEGYNIFVQVVFANDDLRVVANSNEVTLRVMGNGNVYGHVYAEDGTPVKGATVTFKNTTFTTDAEGYYKGEAMAGQYDATATKDDFRNATQTVNVGYDGNTLVDFTMQYVFSMVKEIVATEAADYNSVTVEWTYESAEPVVFDFENSDLTENGMTSYIEIYEGNDHIYSTTDYETPAYEIVEDANAPSGAHYIKSTIEGQDNYTACLSVNVTLSYDGMVSFYSKKSTEYYDYGKFYIDGVNQNCYPTEEWAKYEYQVPAGTHTLKWTYEKDYSNSGKDDALYIDNIVIFDNVKYNVYVKEILAATEEEQLATEIVNKEYIDKTWASLAAPTDDGIYQYGVSVLYNRPAMEILNETFDDLDNWTTYKEGEACGFYVGTTNMGDNVYEGVSSACCISYDNTSEMSYLVSPKLNTMVKATLKFYYIVPEFGGDIDEFNVVYGTTPEGPWTDLTEVNEGSVEEWTQASIVLPKLEEIYIAFTHKALYGGGVSIDNVVITTVEESGESKIAWSNNVARGNHFIVDGDYNTADSWSRGNVATADEVAVIDAKANLAATSTVKALFVNKGAMEIAENGILNANDAFNEEAEALLINAGGQLVHANEGVMATFVKDIKAYTGQNDGWYTISSPLATDVNASDVANMLNGKFDLYRYDEPTHYWENYEDNLDEEGPDNTDWDSNGAVIEQGRGYLYANSADTELSFVGELNTAAVERELSAQADILTGFNLLGNPFAHDIYKGVAFAKGEELREGYYTLNYHGAWQASTDDAAIKSGAGFLVQTDNDATSINIDKVNAAPARKANNAMIAVSVVNSRYEDVTYVSFNDGLGLEKIGHMNEYIPMVYVPGTFNNFAIATVEEDVTEIPVNFEAMTMGEYTIAVKAKNCEYSTMMLIDKFTGNETNLLEDSYTFMATTTDDPDRFMIKLSEEDSETEDSFIYINNGELVFDNLSNDAIINVFDVLGRNIATFNNCGDTTYRVSTDLFADGVYMVRLIEGNNVKVQKVVIE